MIKINTCRPQREFIVFENENEAELAGIKYHRKLQDVREGDYFLTDNGYYIPCWYYAKFKDGTTKKSAKHEYAYLTHKFPYLTLSTRVYTKEDKPLFWRPIKWSRDIDYDERILDERQQGIINFMEQGLSLFQAIETMYKGKKGWGVDKILRLLVNNNEFFNKLRKSKVMSSLKTSFEEVGITETWLAEKMKSIMEEEKGSPILKNNTLNLIFNLFAKQEPKEINSMQILTQSPDGEKTAMLINNTNNESLRDKFLNETNDIEYDENVDN